MDNESFGNSAAKIIGISDSYERIPAAAGRISTRQGDALTIFSLSDDPLKNSKLIKKVTSSGHNSTIEHTVFNIAFNNVSVFAEQFMIEFRLASFTVKSRRYVDFSNIGYYVPKFKDDKLYGKYKETMDFLFSEYSYFLESGVPKEDARFVLPYCLRSNFYCAANARELLHILKAMIFGRGSLFPEIKNLGEQILSQVKELTPGICEDFLERSKDYKDALDLDFKVDDNLETPGKKEKTEILSKTVEPEKLIAKTALISSGEYSGYQIDKIIENEENVKKIVEEVILNGRPRALESVNYTFKINGVSLSGITHFARHRMQSLIVPSLTKARLDEYIIPDTIKRSPEILKRYKKCFNKALELYDFLKNNGVEKETLVYTLLSGSVLNIALTMNGRELLLFIKLRTCNRAQWEIRDFAIDMLMKLRKESPLIFGFYGPGCYLGECPEGALSCGKRAETRNFFKNLR